MIPTKPFLRFLYIGFFSPLVSFHVSAFILTPRQSSNSSTNSTNNDGVHLAVSPKCASSLTGNVSDISAGLLPLSSYKTIVAFGDEYTSGGEQNGSALLPAQLSGTDPRAGGRFSNGPVWVENLASDVGAKLMDYATAGAVTDNMVWPSKKDANDFVNQTNVFTSQHDDLDPNTTLLTVFFGINDFAASEVDNTEYFQLAADAIVYQIEVLASSPPYAKHFLVLDNYGRGSSSPAGDAYKQSVFEGLNALHTKLGLNVGYVDFKTVWDGVLHNPGYAAFGYSNQGFCTTSTTTVGKCDDPEHTFYWIDGYPSKETHRIMADYVKDVMANCTASG
ncbi:hypothetical protein BD410DRAFT_441687 [Rickenella mellea]|uniref:Carbohydrate esterase family 16 protein n=1 Tax=Rickenella mellea TaxID=50990 RepID=A0A4Y7PWI4_9AGAM|nr:hypothetical protein BD410DRAFT_441687 [Rickenella mellea]